MAFKKVGGERIYCKYSDCNPGDVLVDDGVYIGSEEGKYGVIHLFQVGDAVKVLNSAGQLNYKIDKFVPPGMRCRVIYDGKETLTKGPMSGKESHNFEVMVDDGSDSTPPPVTAKAVAEPPKFKAAAKAATVKKKSAAAVAVSDDIEL